ncbi:MAG: hypothetical protein JST86_17730 [Bacteroidetes bacterium]|nr:hypothetical protein [Bacteroidota bacterium]
MKLTATVLAATFLFTTPVLAQNTIPEGYTKATITLADGSTKTGFIKDDIRKSAAITFTDGNSAKKVYQGIDINGVTIDAATYLCINGDFFKVISNGKMSFLQKASNASGNASYNGSEAVFSSGTEGKIGDYFIYADKKLQLINKKTVNAFINADLASCTPAAEKAKTINGDIAKLQEAVDIYNQSAH